jgi:hypothetical protein
VNDLDAFGHRSLYEQVAHQIGHADVAKGSISKVRSLMRKLHFWHLIQKMPELMSNLYGEPRVAYVSAEYRAWASGWEVQLEGRRAAGKLSELYVRFNAPLAQINEGDTWRRDFWGLLVQYQKPNDPELVECLRTHHDLDSVFAPLSDLAETIEIVEAVKAEVSRAYRARRTALRAEYRLHRSPWIAKALGTEFLVAVCSVRLLCGVLARLRRKDAELRSSTEALQVFRDRLEEGTARIK